jgi:hypothetical protein
LPDTPSGRRPRLSLADRAGAWLVTGPIGRVAAFFADLAVYWWRWASGRDADRRSR